MGKVRLHGEVKAPARLALQTVGHKDRQNSTQ